MNEIVGLFVVLGGIMWAGEYLAERFAAPIVKKKEWPGLVTAFAAWVIVGVLIVLLRLDFVSPVVARLGLGWGQPYDMYIGVAVSVILGGLGSSGLHELLVKWGIGGRGGEPTA